MARLLSIPALLASAPAAAGTAQASPDLIPRAGAAVAELNRALDRLGGSHRVASAPSVAWETKGKLYWLNQGPTPEQSMEFELRQRQYSDFEAGLTYVAFDFSGPESSFERSTVLRHSDRSAELLEFLALSPIAVLRQLAASPADLRPVSRGDGRTVIAGPMLDRLVELEIGADGLPQALSYVFQDDLLGDAVRRFEYLDYRRQDGWNAPRRVRQLNAGRVVRDAAVEGFGIDDGRPEWAQRLEPEQAHPPDSSTGFAAERIAPGIYHLKQYGNSDYHGLGAELADGWMVLETPFAIGDGAALRKALAAISPKPVVYAAATHHHDDHSAGMAALRDDPVTVLTTPGNVGYFRTMIEATRNFSPPGGNPRVAALSPGQRVGPVQFLTIDASPHVKEMLLFYFPEQRILFHSDLGRFNQGGSVEPARPQTCGLWTLIQREGLAVERIYSGHGRPGTIDDLRRAIELRDTPCP